MTGRSEVLFEGYTEDELLDLPREEIEAMILTGEPVVFRAGSATILGEFRVEGSGCASSWPRLKGAVKGF
jgi:hypothetical protein